MRLLTIIVLGTNALPFFFVGLAELYNGVLDHRVGLFEIILASTGALLGIGTVRFARGVARRRTIVAALCAQIACLLRLMFPEHGHLHGGEVFALGWILYAGLAIALTAASRAN